MKAWVEEETLLIRVTDNGEGMNQEELEALREKLSRKDEIENIGMRNIQRRIELTFGLEQAMEIQSVKGEGTTITIRMDVCREV